MSKTLIWYTADHRDIQVRQMETSHILRCLRLIEHSVFQRRRPWRLKFFRPLMAELRKRRAA